MHDASHTMLITMAVAMSMGVFLTVIARRINVSAIVLLLIGGVALGPEALGLVNTASLGNGLSVIVSLSVGLILFEGGLTLDLRGYRPVASVIHRLLSVGLLATWLTSAGAIWVIFRFDVAFCLLAASLVIAPLLKRIKVNVNLHSILHWEGVLIDPVGVFIAILCFEWLGAQSRELVLARFVLRFVWGIGLGVLGGIAIHRLLRSRLVADDVINVFALGSAILIFGAAEALFSESGLLAVTVAGFVLGVRGPGHLKEIRQFKAEITDLLIGTLFILLSARLELAQFQSFGIRGALVVAAVIVLARPLNILVSSVGCGLSWREKGFLSWVAPRGIVAASMASLFALRLQEAGFENAGFLETFTYSVIIATVLLQGFTAGPVARPDPVGWLIVGAHRLGRHVAAFISQTLHLPTILIDTNAQAVSAAQAEGLNAILDDARDPDLKEDDNFQEIGNLLALTDNEDLNMLLCDHWSDVFSRRHVHYWSAGKEVAGEFTGEAVWVGLPKPSAISGELDRGEATILRTGGHVPESAKNSRPLITASDGLVKLNAGGLLPEEDFDASLLLRREADYLTTSIGPRRVLRIEGQPSVAELLSDIVSHLGGTIPGLPVEQIVQELVRREEFFSSALGHGVAVPHAYSSSIEERACAIVQVPDGIEFNAADGEPVRLLFLLLSPPGDAEGHLETMAEIARMVSSESTRSQLLEAESSDTLWDIISRSPAEGA